MSGPRFYCVALPSGMEAGIILWPERGIAEAVMTPEAYAAALGADRIKNGRFVPAPGEIDAAGLRVHGLPVRVAATHLELGGPP